MAKYKFKSDLSQKGIQNLIDKLQEYKTETLEYKRNLLVDELLVAGAKEARTKVFESPLGNYVEVTAKMESSNGETRGYLITTGETFYSEGYEPFHIVLAIEFGAGIHYNHKNIPKASEFGYGVGTFPGQTHAQDENGWWFFDEKTDTWKHSYGIEATMPMYEADKAMIQKFNKIAREAFKR